MMKTLRTMLSGILAFVVPETRFRVKCTDPVKLAACQEKCVGSGRDPFGCLLECETDCL
ncbi:hypothetical protein [Kitasatospora sp. NPDC094016]|uniref:hypothetical protein n=1 Tax=Kitasatospora sp. NPDC094016 TaxID=3154986 RepID=UPI003327CBC8